MPGEAPDAITRPERDYELTGGGTYNPEQLANALARIDVEKYRKHSWFATHVLGHHATAGDGREEWIEWSTSDPNYADQGEMIGRRWDSLHKEKPGGITVRTLNKALADAGATDAQAAPDAGEDFDAIESPDIADGLEPPKLVINPTPYEWVEPAEIPQREWLYKPAYIAGYVSLTTAAGGGGKSSLVRAECAAIASGKPLLNITPTKRTKVWYWNGEDPIEELARGFAAIRIHYGLQKSDLQGWLFTDSGRDTPIKVAIMKRGDMQIAVPVVDAIIDAIKTNGIGVMVVDPFVTCHSVNENDNTMMNEVVDQWRKIADATGCAIHLVHHTRKTNGEAATIEAARGASAVSSAARVRRAINTMTVGEADAAGIERADRFRYISADYRSTSFIASGEAVAWYKFESVNLGNGDCGDGESIGVVTACEISDLNLRAGDEAAALDAIRAGGPWRKAAQSGERWVGRPIAEGLGLDPDNTAHRKRLNSIIGGWLASGVLKEVAGKRDNRTATTFIEVAEEADMDFG